MPAGQLERAYLQAVIHLNRLAKSAAVRLTRLTGKSRVPIHPKHLANLSQSRWYLEYVEPGQPVLDVGCGHGIHTLRVAGRAGTTAGLDYNWHHLQMAKMLSNGLGTTAVTFLLGHVEQGLPFAGGAFQRVLLLDVIEHLHRRVELLREIYRVLRPEGLLLLSAPNSHTRWKQRLQAAGLFSYTDPDHKVEYCWDELVAELRAGGFEPRDQPTPIVYDTPWAGFIDLTGGLSLSLYRRLSEWKRQMAGRYPDDTTGWRVVCRKVASPS